MTSVALRLDNWGRLVLTDADGKEHVGVEVVRSFPITDPSHGISLMDSGGRELLWIEDLDELPEPIQRLLAEELPRREFLPQLRRLLRVSGTVEPTEWEVETDRGVSQFILNSEDDVRRLGDKRAIVLDAHGIRYLIEDVEALDAHSRRLLERYL